MFINYVKLISYFIGSRAMKTAFLELTSRVILLVVSSEHKRL